MGDQEITPQQPPRQQPVNIEDEMRASCLGQAMSVIIGRKAIDART